MTEMSVKTVGNATTCEPAVAPVPRCPPAGQAPFRTGEILHDFRFQTLLGKAAWARLPAAVRSRFSRRLSGGAAVTYAGEIVATRQTCIGVLIAQVCRVIGAPLPLCGDVAVPAVVTVTEDARTGGQFWTRMYGRKRGFPQVIHSSKRFAGPTGLEEYLGWGFGIALTVSASDKALYFHSHHYFLCVGGIRLRLPSWMGPGELTISHVEHGGGPFSFVLTLRHPLFGEIISQTGVFRERRPSRTREQPDD